jgi:pimeloyl-ACP methyl ester carboxylesterase
MGMWFERYRSDLAYKTVQVDEQTFAYLEREGEGETIVFLHGFTADKDNWIRFVRHMPKEYRILAIDMPGHGDSIRDMDQTYKVEYFTSRVTRTIEALGLERIHLVGSSFGGLVSTHYGLDNPDKVITLGLFDSLGISSPTPSELQHLLDEEDNPFFVTSRADYDRLMDLCFYEQPYLPWPARSVFARKYIQRRGLYQKMWNDLRRSYPPRDMRDRLPEVKMPTFLLWGNEDRLLHVSCVEVYKRYLPDVHVVIMQNCGHLPMIERPKEAAGHYVRFLRQVSGTKGE